MKTLIIYDNTGKIWNNMSGSYEVPTGIPYLEVEILSGQYPVSVDVSGTEPIVIYAEPPKSEVLIRLEELETKYNALANKKM